MASRAALAAKNAALSYAWIVVSFDAWEYGLRTLRALLGWDGWRAPVKAALFALYPMYFGYSSAKMTAAYKDARAFPAKRRWPFSVAMVLLFALGTVLGRRHGTAARLES
jgi:hypothetical protein